MSSITLLLFSLIAPRHNEQYSEVYMDVESLYLALIARLQR